MKSIQKSKKNKLKIGKSTFNSIVALAPMAGITDTVFRRIVRMFSKDCLLSTEMISSEALRVNKNQSIIDYNQVEYPVIFQITGHKPELMAEAAKILEGRSAIIDINMGCPVSKIVKNFDGCSLMNDLSQASKIIKSVKDAVNIPVSVKCRLGWNRDSKNVVEFAKMAQDSGADAITVHGRTKAQMYGGKADWNAIGEVKSSVNIPVIANGDIDSPKKALECLEITNCDGIAIARGVLGDPGLIYRIEKAIYEGEILPSPDIKEKLDTALIHCEKEMEYRGEIYGLNYMRKFFACYIKGVKGAAAYRSRLVRVEKYSQVREIFEEIVSNA